MAGLAGLVCSALIPCGLVVFSAPIPREDKGSSAAEVPAFVRTWTQADVRAHLETELGEFIDGAILDEVAGCLREGSGLALVCGQRRDYIYKFVSEFPGVRMIDTLRLASFFSKPNFLRPSATV